MKTIKIAMVSSILLFVLALSFAFVPDLRKSSGKSSDMSKKTATDKKVVVGVWFIYTHASSDWGHAQDPNNYRRLAPGESVNTLCQGTQKLCAILADPDPNYWDEIPLIPYNSFIYNQLNNYFIYGYVQNGNFVKLKN